MEADKAGGTCDKNFTHQWHLRISAAFRLRLAQRLWIGHPLAADG
jgi:hypothetical protein